MNDIANTPALMQKFLTMKGTVQLLLRGDDEAFFTDFMKMVARDTQADRIALVRMKNRRWEVMYSYGTEAPDVGEEISLNRTVNAGPLDSWHSDPTANVGWDAFFEVEGNLPYRTVLAIDDTTDARDFTDLKTVFKTIAEFLGGLIKLRGLMTKDTTTGLPNHRACLARLDEELLRVIHHEPKRAIISLVALDRYGECNIGSEIKNLRYLAKLLCDGLPETTFIGRIADDRFLVIMDGELEDAHQRLDAIRVELAGTQQIIATCSAGIALMTPELVINPSVERATAALEKALKKHDRICVDPTSSKPPLPPA